MLTAVKRLSDLSFLASTFTPFPEVQLLVLPTSKPIGDPAVRSVKSVSHFLYSAILPCALQHGIFFPQLLSPSPYS